MSLNPTLNYLLEKLSVSVMTFGAALTTESRYLAGAGDGAGDGFPLPLGGEILGMRVWDGSNGSEKLSSVSVSAGNRVSVFAQHTGTDYVLTLRINDVDTSITISGVKDNTTIFACVLLSLQRS